MASRFEYAPAPESRSVVDIQSSYGLFIGGEFVDPADGASFKTVSPATEEVLAEVAEAGRGGRRPRGEGGPPRLHPRVVADARRGSGRSTSSASPASSRSARASSRCWSRSTTASRSRRRRDVDVPRGRAVFFYYAGWADKLGHAGFGPDPQPLGVAGQVIPWNFPLLMLAWKIAPGAGLRQHGGAQAGRDDAADRAAVRRDLPAGRPAARASSTSSPAPARPAARSSRTTTSTRWRSPAPPTSAGRSRAPSPAPTRRSRSSSAARPRTSSSTTPRSTRPSRASSTASSSTRATSAARAPGCWCRSRWPRRCSSGSSAGWPRCASATRSTRTPTSARSTPPSSSPRSASSPTSARPRAPSAGRRACDLPSHGFWFPPTVFTGVTQAHRIAREEIFGPVLSVLTFRTPAEAVAEGEQHPVRAVRRHLDRQGLAHPLDGRPAPRRRGVGQHVQQVRPDQPRSAATRSRATAARAAATVWRPTCDRRDVERRRRGTRACSKTYKLYVGGAFPRSESGRSYAVHDSKGGFLANAAHASRKDARDAVQAARKAFGGWSARTPYNRGQVVYRIAEVLEGRRAQFVDEVQRGEGLTKRQAEAVVDAVRRPARLVRRLGRQDRAGRRRHQPGRGAVLQLLAARAHRRRRGRGAAGVVAARAGQRGRPGRRHRQHRRRRDLRASGRCRRSRCRGPRDLRRAGRRRQRAHRRAVRHRPDAGRAHGRQRPRPDRPGGRPRARRATSRSRPPRTSSGCCARPPPSRTGRPSPASTGSPGSSRPRRSGTRSASEPRRSVGSACFARLSLVIFFS